MAAQTAPYGSWKTPISTDLVAAAALGLGQIVLDGDDVYHQLGLARDLVNWPSCGFSLHRFFCSSTR
jgi:hypothetical protein